VKWVKVGVATEEDLASQKLLTFLIWLISKAIHARFEWLL
jgi:hypothetical protein